MAAANSQHTEATISKNEAVKRAVAELGREATTDQIQRFVKDRFGFVLSPNHVSAARSKALHSMIANGKSTSLPEPRKKQTTPRGKVNIPAEKITKQEAVRRAIAALGKRAKRGPIQAYVKNEFGIDMDLARVSTARTAALRKKPRKKRATKQIEAAQPDTQASRGRAKPIHAETNKGTIQFEDLVTLKDLLQRVGADHLRKLIDLVS